MVSGVPAWRRGHNLAHEMQTAGELAGLEGTISLLGTEHTGVSAAPFRGRRRDRFREGKQRLYLSIRSTLWIDKTQKSYLSDLIATLVREGGMCMCMFTCACACCMHMCMCMCMFSACACACTCCARTCVHVHMLLHAHMHMCTCTCTCTCIICASCYMCTCTYAQQKRTCTYACACACACTCVHFTICSVSSSSLRL